MSQIKLFSFGTEQVRVSINENNEPVFCAIDVTSILGYTNGRYAISKHCSPKGVAKRYTLTQGGIQSLTYISEGNLYRLVAKSNKPEAEKFEEWVFDEVLPTIRKHGVYATENFVEQALSDPDAMISVLTQLKAERQQRQLAESKAALQEEINRHNMPKVLFADSVAASNGVMLVGDLAKILKQNGIDMGAFRLFKYLRANGYLIKREGTDYNLPTQRSMDLGLFEINETAITRSSGEISVNKTPRVTGKGQLYFVNKFLYQKHNS